jgi:hypothetical protein
MKAFGIAPPLLTQIVVTILGQLSHGESDIVQFDIRIAAIASNVEHE